MQALNGALEGLTFTPNANSNAFNTDDLAAIRFTVDDLGLSGEGGPQESEPLTIRLLVEAINDGPLLHLPNPFAAREDVPLLLSGINVSDVDSGEHGGKVLNFGCAKVVVTIIAIPCNVQSVCLQEYGASSPRREGLNGPPCWVAMWYRVSSSY